MAEYIDIPIDTDPQDILNDFIKYMQIVIPGWTPGLGNLDTWIAQAMSLAAAETRDVASAVPKSIFRFFGATLVNFPPIDAAPATVLTDWTVQDTAGYTIPAGTQVSIAATGDVVFAFETTEDVVIAPGDDSVTGVQITATVPGAASSGLGTTDGEVDLIDPLAFVTAITQEAATAGGIDAEDDDTYLNRLATELQLLAPRPILPDDFSVFARNIPGVARAVTLDGYNPDDDTSDNPRLVAVAGIDVNGDAIDGGHKSAVVADLESRREVNFIVKTLDVTANMIDVTYTVKALAGYDPTALLASINAALTAYLSPATWGGVAGDPVAWENQPTVRYLEVAQVINSVLGVDYITGTGSTYDLTINIHGDSPVRTDVAMTGKVPLPQADTLSGTIT